MRYVIHDAAGAILWAGQTNAPPEEVAAWIWPEGAAFLEVAEDVANPLAWRVQAGALVARAVMAPSFSAASIAAGSGAATLSGLPDPCTVSVQRQRPGAAPIEAGLYLSGPAEVAGGSLALSSAEPGRLVVDVSAGLEYAPWRGTVEVT
jgi:hypothetical protein